MGMLGADSRGMVFECFEMAEQLPWRLTMLDRRIVLGHARLKSRMCVCISAFETGMVTDPLGI